MSSGPDDGTVGSGCDVIYLSSINGTELLLRTFLFHLLTRTRMADCSVTRTVVSRNHFLTSLIVLMARGRSGARTKPAARSRSARRCYLVTKRCLSLPASRMPLSLQFLDPITGVALQLSAFKHYPFRIISVANSVQLLYQPAGRVYRRSMRVGLNLQPVGKLEPLCRRSEYGQNRQHFCKAGLESHLPRAHHPVPQQDADVGCGNRLRRWWLQRPSLRHRSFEA